MYKPVIEKMTGGRTSGRTSGRISDRLVEPTTFTKILYHGSKNKIDRLEPRMSKVVQNEPVVFATQERWFATNFIAPTTGKEISSGIFRGKPYLLEVNPGTFALFETDGYLHLVSSKGFHPDKRLGMSKHEFISRKAVPVLAWEYVPNVRKMLEAEGVQFISYKSGPDWDEIRKYDSNPTTAGSELIKHIR